MMKRGLGGRVRFPMRLVTTAVIAALLFPRLLAAQAADSVMVILERPWDEAFALVERALVLARVEVAVASPEQGLFLSAPMRIGRAPQFAYILYQATLRSRGPITVVVLRGSLSPDTTLQHRTVVTASTFGYGSVVWGELQHIGRILKEGKAPEL